MSHTIGQAKQDEQSNFNSDRASQDSPKSEAVPPVASPKLSDTDYEFLFNQLLEGIAHGWHDRRIIKFFQQLGNRGLPADWVAWLERLRSKLLKLPVESKRQVGTLMIRLGELTQSASEVNQIGAASHQIGRELLFGKVPAEIWEYVGPDLVVDREVESEQELSARLPNDFVALGGEEETSESPAASQSELSANESADLEVNPVDASDTGVLEKIDPGSASANFDTDLWSAESETDSPTDSQPEADAPAPDDSATATSAAALESPSELESELLTELASDEGVSAGTGNVKDDNFKSEEDLSEQSEAAAIDLAETKNIPSSDVTADLTSEPTANVEQLSTALEAFEREPESHNELETEAEPLNLPSDPKQSPAAQENLELTRLTQQASSSFLTEEPHHDSEIAQSSELEAPELDDSSLEVIESWFNLGLKQVSAGEYAKAIASWDRALTINANLSEAWHNRGSALGRLGNYDAAVKSFENALKIDPDNYQAWNDRAHALYQLQSWSDAVESWSQAIKIVPGNHLFWYNRGCALEQLSQWDDAIASYEKALEIKPDFKPGRSRYINLVADDPRPN